MMFGEQIPKENEDESRRRTKSDENMENVAFWIKVTYPLVTPESIGKPVVAETLGNHSCG